MKLISIILVILLFVAFANANHVTFSHEKLSWWMENGEHYIQYAVSINNNSDKQVKSLLFSAQDLHLRNKDEIWNIQRVSHFEYILPHYSSIAPHDSYTFYYIQSGQMEATFSLTTVEYY